MKLAFLGTPQFAVPTLMRLRRTDHEITAVITQPDRPRGRGMRLTPSPVKTVALDLGLPLMQPENVSAQSSLENMRRLEIEAAVVVAYGQILKREFLEIPPLGCINLHPSLLPRYRGPTPIQSVIMAGDRMTGVTTMLLDEGVDSGDILLQRVQEISRKDTAGTLHSKLAEAGAQLMVETIDALESGSAVPMPQDKSKMTMTRKLTKADAAIDWKISAEEIFNLVRAMNPMPGCHTYFGSETVKIWKVEPVEEMPPHGESGEVLQAEGGDLIVKAGEDSLKILELQPAGGRRMPAEEFMRGREIAAGIVFGD